MNEVEIECECGTIGWFEIKNEAYVTICPCCHKHYKINTDGTVSE